MKRMGMLILVLLVSQALWLRAALAKDDDSIQFARELSKQEEICQSRGEQVPIGYTIDRSLQDYTEMLSSGFDYSLANLGQNDRWLDIGAGKGQAILDYYGQNHGQMNLGERDQHDKKAQVVAMSIEDRMTLLWQRTAANVEANRMQYLYGKLVREYSVEELGRFQVITDVIGGFSYTDNLSLFVKKVMDFLELNGNFYTVLGDVRWEDGTNRPFYPGSSFLTEISNDDGLEVGVCTWLKSISCTEVTCEPKIGWRPPIVAFHIRKICNDVVVPDLMPIHYKAGTPPERGFQLIK